MGRCWPPARTKEQVRAEEVANAHKVRAVTAGPVHKEMALLEAMEAAQ
jgi:hypothetical protein